MKIENYKSAMRNVQISESKYKELCDIIDGVNEVPVSVSTGKKIRRLSIPLLIAAAILLTAGITIFAAEWGGLSRLKDYFDKKTNDYNISNIPVIEDAEI